MPHPPPTARRIEDLLRDLGPRLRRGVPASEAPRRLATGVPEIDRLLGGGFPGGRLSEICGANSSGRTSLALALLARTTQAGELCAVVDACDGFDPAAAEAAGAALTHVLWARAPSSREALRASERLLEAGGFGLILLDLAAGVSRVAPSAWLRLARSAAGTRAALLLISLQRSAGSAAEVALEMRARQARFEGTPPLLEALEVEARLVRGRGAPADPRARVQLRSPGA
jgi:RecA/RadA recombinase